MRKLTMILAMVAGVLATPCALAQEAGGGERIALVIGIDDYRALGKLTTCRADAEALAKVLVERGGYRADRVVLLVDGAPGGEGPTTGAIRRRGIQLARLAEAEDTVLFFFSGHGVTRDGKGYLVPLDGDAMTAIPLDWIREKL
ncbi:MAG: caspase family protein, partial [Planctomycetes bacterium]|nr:caspase family protein [Planctomycetota bacterium]